MSDRPPRRRDRRALPRVRPGRPLPVRARCHFTPVDVPKERLLALHELLGLDRAVIVQSACHGTDHAALLDALAAGTAAGGASR